MKIINTLTAFVEHKGKQEIGYKTYFEYNGKNHYVETLTNDKKVIVQKIKELVDKLK